MDYTLFTLFVSLFTMISPIYTLPDHILPLIFDHLDKGDLVRAAEVDRRFRAAATQDRFWLRYLPFRQLIAKGKAFEAFRRLKQGQMFRTIGVSQTPNTRCIAIHGKNAIFWNDQDKELKIKDFDGLSFGRILGEQANIASTLVVENRLFVGSSENTIAIYDLQRRCKISTLFGHVGTVFCLTFNKTLISGSWDHTIKVWHLESGKATTLTGHGDRVSCIDANAHFIVSGSEDKTIKVWERSSGRMLHTLDGHKERLIKLAIAGNRIYSGSFDDTFLIWDLHKGQQLLAPLPMQSRGSWFDPKSVDLKNGTIILGSSRTPDDSTPVCLDLYNLETGTFITSFSFSLALRQIKVVAIGSNYFVWETYGEKIYRSTLCEDLCRL